MIIKTEHKIKMPEMPSFLEVISYKGETDITPIDIGALDDESFVEFSNAYTSLLHIHYNKRRLNHNNNVDLT